MAKVLKEMPMLGHSKYPWDEWTDGQVWQAEQGTDFTKDPESFRAQLYGRASREGKSVKATVDGTRVIFQFTS